eukprot:6463996-Amphidinium_carterae.2
MLVKGNIDDDDDDDDDDADDDDDFGPQRPMFGETLSHIGHYATDLEPSLDVSDLIVQKALRIHGVSSNQNPVQPRSTCG